MAQASGLISHASLQLGGGDRRLFSLLRQENILFGNHQTALTSKRNQVVQRKGFCQTLRECRLILPPLQQGIEILKRHELQPYAYRTHFIRPLLDIAKVPHISMGLPRLSAVALSLGASLISLDLGWSAMQAACSFLPPVGGDGNSDIVKKRVGKAKLIGHTNWNTDFAVNGPFTSYKLFFTADSTANGTYPVEAFLKFTDGSNLRVVKESLTPPIGTGRMFGPFTVPQGKQVNQVNFKIGAGSDPNSTGFSYRISVQGCN